MAKAKNPDFGKIKKYKPEQVYAKRTIKTSSGDDFTHNIRSVRLKPKRSKN